MGLSKQIFQQMQEEFLDNCDNFENGDISALECAVMFKKDNDYLEQLINERKNWMNENKESIADESEKYGKEGFKGFCFSVQHRKTLDFSAIPQVVKLKADIKDIETNGKLALQLIEKGIEPVDAKTGELLPVPSVTNTSFLKADRVK